MWYFLHIPKTGGSSVIRVLRELLGPRAVHVTNGKAPLEGPPKRTPEGAPVYMGHFAYGELEPDLGPGQYATVLRDPIERTLSNFYYVKRMQTRASDEKRALDSVDNLTDAYRRGLLRNHFDNVMTRNLSGVHGVDFGELSQAHYHSAWRNLKSCGLVGTTDRLPLFMLMLGGKLGKLQEVKQLSMPREKANSWSWSEVSAQDLYVARLLNVHDYKLYHNAVKYGLVAR